MIAMLKKLLTENNTRELLILEAATIWNDYFSRLKDRGLEQVNLIVADGLKGLENQVMLHFPKAKLQKCVVHKQRSHLKKKHIIFAKNGIVNTLLSQMIFVII